MTQTQNALPPPRTQGRIERIDNSINRDIAGEIMVREGGLAMRSVAECMEVAKMMSIADTAVPAHLRANPGACLAICLYAMEWGMSPFSVANKSYVVNDRLSFESQLIHAVVEKRGPLQGRLRHSFEGEGDNRTCTVTGKLKGDDEPFEITSPPIGKITPKNSPLWKSKPDIQLFYNTCRDWARVYCPDVILGIYSDDELTEAVKPPADEAKSGVQKVKARLLKTKTDEPKPAAEQQATATETKEETKPDESVPSPEKASAPADTSPAENQGAAPDASEEQKGIDLEEQKKEEPAAEEPAEPDFKDFRGFMDAMNKLCVDRKITQKDKEQVATVLRQKISAIGKKDKHNDIKLPTLIGWYQQAVDAEGLFEVMKKK